MSANPLGAKMPRVDLHRLVTGMRDDGLTFREIASRLGRAKSTVTSAYYDPTGEQDRARKARRAGTCVDCGTATFNSGSKPPKRCNRCEIAREKTDPALAAVHSAANRGRNQWTDEQIFEALRLAARDGTVTQPNYNAMRAKDPSRFPSRMTISLRFDRWALAVRAAGLNPGGRDRGPYASRTHDERIYEAIRACAADTGRRPTVSEYEAWARSRKDMPSFSTVRNRCGSWMEACAAALNGNGSL